MTDAIVIGGSRGIGRSIADALKSAGCNVTATSKSQIDTSDLKSVEKFTDANPETDVLVLNTGGPPPKKFQDITRDDWEKFHNQLFVGFCLLLQKIKVRDGGYIFLISSSVIKEPSPKLILSSAYRLAFSSILKVLSKDFARKNISCVNIAPGPINTDRTRELVDNIEKFQAELPMQRLGEPSEIGSLVGSIIKNKIKYLSGAVISFDGAGSNHIF